MKSTRAVSYIDKYANGVNISWRRRQKAEILAETIDNLSTDTTLQIVDFGCADGAIPVLLLNSTIGQSITNITGITLLNYNDLPGKPSFFHTRFTRVIADLNSDLTDVTLPWGNCDIITATAFFHYLNNPATAFTHAANLLKPGGYLIITIPVRWLLTIRKSGIPYILPKNNYIKQIEPLDIWSTIAVSAGFNEIERSAIQWLGIKQSIKIEEIFRKNQMFINLSTNWMMIYRKN